MLVVHKRKRGTPLTPEQIAEIREAAKYPIVFDEDCPETTPEMLEELREAVIERNKLLASLGLPLPSEGDDPANRAEVTEEQRRQIDAFWKERVERQRQAAKAKQRLAENNTAVS